MPPIVFIPPRWQPKEPTAPLKEEYLLFYQQVTWYHDQIKGSLAETPKLIEGALPKVPAALDTFTNKTAIIIMATNLVLYLIQAIYNDMCRKHVEATTPAPTLSGSVDHKCGRPKIKLPTSFEGSTTTTCTFLSECNNYISLNQSQFTSDSIKVQWALQLCTRKAANWKRIQLELGESYNIPDYLLSWGSFQDEFKLEWADLNLKEKAQDQFHVGIKQTGSICQYTKIFKEVILKAEFANKQILASAFYASLKPEIKMHLVGRHPDTLKELKSITIRLDEECTTAQGSDHCKARLRLLNHTSEIVSSL